jgi:hypothetical protein
MYLSGSATNAPQSVSFDNLDVTDPDAGPLPENVAPIDRRAKLRPGKSGL